MRRSSSSTLLPVLPVLAVLAALGLCSASPASAHGGNEATYHSLPASQAPTVTVSASPVPSGYLVDITTTNFAWSTSTNVANFTSGQGIAVVYFDDVKFGKVYGPRFVLDPVAFDPIPGEHSIVVSIAGDDMVSYAADGTEVEASATVQVPAPTASSSTLEAPAASFEATLVRDPFGGFTIAAKPHDVPAVAVSIDGVPYTVIIGPPIHVAESDRGIRPGPHTVTLRAVSSEGAALLHDGAPIEVSASIPAVGDTAVVTVSTSAPGFPWWWLVLGVAIGVAAMLVALQVYRRHVRVAVSGGGADGGSGVEP